MLFRSQRKAWAIRPHKQERITHDEMGIIGDFVGHVAADTAGKILDKSIDVIEAKETQKRQKLFRCAPGEKVLLINKEQYLLRDKFSVYDENESVVYSVKRKLVSAKPHLFIYDAHGGKLGTVKQKLLALRASTIRESHAVDFDFIVNGQRVGRLQSTRSITKRKYLLDNGWTVEGNILGLKYNIIADGKPIATISQKILFWGDTYLIRFPRGANEILILMIVLAIDVANAPSRTDKIKDAFRFGEDSWDDE